jgi:hypothetical protein
MTMIRLTEAERARICTLYKQLRDRLGHEKRSETPWQTARQVAAEVGWAPQTVRYTLVAAALIDPPRPDLDDLEIEAIAVTYARNRSIRRTARIHRKTYGSVRSALLYKGVKLRSPGGNTRTAP